MKKGNNTKYFIFVIAVAATVFVWISLMKAQDIPAPIFQGFLYTLLIFSISRFIIKNHCKSRTENRPISYMDKVWNILDNYFKSSTHKHRWLTLKYRWTTFKHYAGIAAVVIIFIAFIIFIIAALFAEPKIPATPEEVRAAIVNQGYEPLDYTESYYEVGDGFKQTLISCVAFEKDDIHFEFFEFNNNNTPKDIYGQAYQKITIKYNSWQQIETEETMANYSLYTIDCDGKYNVASFVENTAVYAYCDSVNKNEIDKILDSIDYLRSGNNRDE